VASEPEKDTPTARAYQPFASGPRSRTGETLGGVLSTRIVTVKEVLPSGPSAVQVTAVPFVSLDTVTGFGAHIFVMFEPTNVTVTLDRYQPLQLAGPGEHVAVSVGGAAGAAPATRRAARAAVQSAAATMEVRADNVSLRRRSCQKVPPSAGGGQSVTA
jgi:hypothetical protein